MAAKKRKITLQEIIIVAAVALLAAGFIIYSVLSSSSAAVDSTAQEISEVFNSSSSFKSAVNALGDENILPEEEGYYYVWFDDKKEVEKISYDDMTFVSGYVYGENSCCITIYCDGEYGKIVGYSKYLNYDILSVNVVFSTGSFSPLSENIELDFVKYYLTEKCGSCAFISGGKALCVKGGEIAEDDEAYKKSELYVIDTLSSSVITLIESFTRLKKAVVYDAGSYIVEDGCIFASRYSTLVYAFPFAESVVCKDGTFSVAEGALVNADNLKEITVPLSGGNLYSLMGENVKNLEKVTFTSCVLAADDLFFGCENLTSVSFKSGFKRFEKGFFDGLELTEIFFGADTEYVYFDFSEGSAAVYVPYETELEGNISSAEYKIIQIDGVKYKAFGGDK